MKKIVPDKVPAALRSRRQWVLWKTAVRTEGDKPTKLPFQISGSMAKADDPKTWSSFDAVLTRYERGGYDGIGYEFSADDGLCGIDLDGCRNPETGAIEPWAKEIIASLDSYSEVSPSQCGVKIFVAGKSPFPRGRKVVLSHVEKVCDKEPAIEVYDWGRYFAVTGWRLAVQDEPQPRQAQLDALCGKFFVTKKDLPQPDAMDRARRYVSRIEGAISGQNGSGKTYYVACVLVLGFGLRKHEAFQVMSEWNASCVPPWSERELWHKINDADKEDGERNYLRFVDEDKWGTVTVPKYEQKAAPVPAKSTTLFECTEQYLNRLKSGSIDVIELGIQSLDNALGGGVERGELVILAARPSHGKSAVALQIVHNWTRQQRPCVMVSEEMSALALGKRALQFASSVPSEHWFHNHRQLERDVAEHFSERAPCYVIEACRTAANAAESVRREVQEKQVQCAVIDYAQLLTGQGKTRYEQVTNTSITMRQLASELNIVVLLLCQLNSDVEKREKFMPMLSDIKDSGQFAQDADVVTFLCWPHRLNSKRDPGEYQFFINKNRNRGIGSPVVTCKFLPSRQMFVEQTAREMPNYEPAFEQPGF